MKGEINAGFGEMGVLGACSDYILKTFICSYAISKPLKKYIMSMNFARSFPSANGMLSDPGSRVINPNPAYK
jgi:hypothetical protein